MPRPRLGRRILSAFESGKPTGLASYWVEGQTKEPVATEFRAAVATKGWRTRSTPEGSIIAEKAGSRVVILVNETQTGQVILSLADFG